MKNRPKKGFVTSRSRSRIENMTEVAKELRKPYRMVDTMDLGWMMYVPFEDMFLGRGGGISRTYMECPVCGNLHAVSRTGITCLSCIDKSSGKYYHWRSIPAKWLVEQRITNTQKRYDSIVRERKRIQERRIELEKTKRASNRGA